MNAFLSARDSTLVTSIGGTRYGFQHACWGRQGQNDVATRSNLSTSSGLVMPRAGQPVFAQGLAFKALEIEELADVYFFRPLGFIAARLAAALRMTPTQMTILSAVVGVAGGVLLCTQRFALLGFALLITYSIFDSADGQLARLTGQVTELGRVLDGVGGYITHAAIYIGIVAGLVQSGPTGGTLLWAALAAISNIAQAQMYEFHRHHYATIVVKGLVLQDDPAKIASGWIKWLYRWYLTLQRSLNGLHLDVESLIATRSKAGVVSSEDRNRYRECFYWVVRGWNLLGDNTRFYAIGVLAWLHRIDLFFIFILVPMNVALVGLWLWQRRTDRKFLAKT
jgi:phosphatidylglycerophosphate synthase